MNKYWIFGGINDFFEIDEKGNWEKKIILVEKKKAPKKVLEKLLEIRLKKNKPFFDDKTQTDLNSFWIYSTLHSSYILDDKNIYNKAINYFSSLQTLLNNNIFHCYNKIRKEVDVFLEDYAYYCLLLVSIYEINKDIKSQSKFKFKKIKNIDISLEKSLINLNRQFLHAKVLGFILPKSGKELEFNSILPQELEKILKNLRKLSK